MLPFKHDKCELNHHSMQNSTNDNMFNLIMMVDYRCTMYCLSQRQLTKMGITCTINSNILKMNFQTSTSFYCSKAKKNKLFLRFNNLKDVQGTFPSKPPSSLQEIWLTQ